jgi:hypothetical protein
MEAPVWYMALLKFLEELKSMNAAPTGTPYIEHGTGYYGISFSSHRLLVYLFLHPH